MALQSKPKPEKDRSERWLLTYADLITLLMVFFVILYSFSIIDVRKFLSLKGSLTQAFNQGVLQGVQTSGLNTSVSGSSVQTQITAASQAAQQSVASQLQQIAEATGDSESISVREQPSGVTVSLSAGLLFQSGTADLKPGAKALLDQISQPLKDIGNPLEVVAYTDDVQPQSTNSKFADNWQVGEARSYSVLRYLIDSDKMPENRLSLGNRGQYSPLYPNNSPENRARNRRVDINIVFPRPQDEPIGQPFQVPVQASAQPSGAASGAGAAGAAPAQTQQANKEP
ncbi:MAG TPA: flagellar motor protein MotB [Chloroflexota bacterium]|nr:flagellar motor protein MotB [Chloroflexota bacterium]